MMCQLETASNYGIVSGTMSQAMVLLRCPRNSLKEPVQKPWHQNRQSLEDVKSLLFATDPFLMRTQTIRFDQLSGSGEIHSLIDEIDICYFE